jgi:hypothetical protein
MMDIQVKGEKMQIKDETKIAKTGCLESLRRTILSESNRWMKKRKRRYWKVKAIYNFLLKSSCYAELQQPA